MSCSHPKPTGPVELIFAVTIAVYSGLVSLIAWSLIPRLGIVADPAWGMDYEVYLRAAREIWTEALYEDREILPFRYPPIAAVFFLPLRLVSEAFGHNVLNTLSVAATVVISYCVLGWYRVGTVQVRQVLAFAATTVLVFGTPWRTELALGQINSILLAFIIIAVTRRLDGARWGALLGVSIAIKLAAGIVVPGLLLLRRWKTAVAAVCSFLLSIVIGFAVIPKNAATFLVRDLPANVRRRTALRDLQPEPQRRSAAVRLRPGHRSRRDPLLVLPAAFCLSSKSSSLHQQRDLLEGSHRAGRRGSPRPAEDGHGPPPLDLAAARPRIVFAHLDHFRHASKWPWTPARPSPGHCAVPVALHHAQERALTADGSADVAGALVASSYVLSGVRLLVSFRCSPDPPQPTM